jgi:hypothetical protein
LATRELSTSGASTTGTESSCQRRSVLDDGEVLPLRRLRYGGYASYFGFAVDLASRDGYEDAILPDGAFEATPKRRSPVPPASTSATPPPGSQINAGRH